LNLTAMAAALLLSQPVAAQTEPAPADKSLERAQKAADAVFHWIKLNADKGASRQAPAPAPAPAAAPAPVARKPAPVAAAPRPAPAPTAAPGTAPVQAAAPAPVVAAAPEPEPERPVLLASAAPTPTPAAPMSVAAQAVEPPPPPAEEAEVPLKLLNRVNPSIPRQMQQQSFRNGFARVKFTVAPDGSISKAETIGASHSRLGAAAVDAVKQWRFSPIPTPREVAIEFAFNNADD
jgi:TonB family protein